MEVAYLNLFVKIPDISHLRGIKWNLGDDNFISSNGDGHQKEEWWFGPKLHLPVRNCDSEYNAQLQARERLSELFM